MDKITTFSAINTKLRILERNYLKKRDYLNMLKMGSVSEVANYLKENTAYKKQFAQVTTATVSRSDIGDILKKNMIDNVDKLIYYFRGDYKILVQSLFLRYEIEDLKNLARSIFNGQKPEEIEKTFSFLGKYSQIEPEKLFKANTVRELINSLEGTEFYDYLKPLLDGRRENLFRFEMALDTSYFNVIQSRRLRISAQDKYLIEKWEGLLADLYNIQWIYRGKKFYHLSSEELLNYTINFGDKLTFKYRQKMCYAKNLVELNRLILDSPYGFLFKKEEMPSEIYMERGVNKFLFLKIRMLSARFPLTIIQTIAYIWKFELEIKDVISIIESIRYKLPGEEAIKFLVKVA